MWTLCWTGVNGEERRHQLPEEDVRDSVIMICATGVSLDSILVIPPNASPGEAVSAYALIGG